MNYFLMVLSVCLEMCKNAVSNHYSKKTVKNDADIYKFNMYLYIGSFVLMLFFKGYSASLFTVLTAFVFALTTAASQHFVMKAFEAGPMSFTVFIQGCNLIIPIIYGVAVLNEQLTLLRVVSVAVLIFSMSLVLNLKLEAVNKKWLIFSVLSMLFTGGIGILQTVHQNSAYKNEFTAFLRLTFLFAVVINCIMWRLCEKKDKSCYASISTTTAAACLMGIFIGAVNIINLYLSGVVDKIVLFPFLNGGLIFASIMVSVIVFREKISVKQWIGLLIGIISMCLLC